MMTLTFAFHACLLGVTLCGAMTSAAEDTARPNLLIILADDMGWNDISRHGSKTPTPHIDRLADSGVAFKNLVVNSVC